MERTVLYQIQGNIAIITLNRPLFLNAINRDLKLRLTEALTRLDDDDDALVGILTGAGKAFSVGRDLKERISDEASGISPSSRDSLSTENTNLWSRPAKPVLAAINGYALGGGWAIAQLCDLRIASEDALLGIPEARVGLLPPFAPELSKVIPMSVVLELGLTGQPITARRAHEIGFVNQVVPNEELMSTTISIATTIANNAPLSVKYFKDLVYLAQDVSAEDLIKATHIRYTQILRSEDATEGPKAFVEKRPPRWKGK